MLGNNDTAIFKVNMTDYSQDIRKKQFQRQLNLPQYKQNVLLDTYVEENEICS